MRTRLLGYIVVTTAILATPLEAQIVPRRVPTAAPTVEAQPQAPTLQALPPATTGATLSRLDDAAPPGNVQAASTFSTVTLIWSPAPGASGYVVSRSLAAAGPFDPLTSAQVSDTQFIDTGLASGSTYFYIVTASRPDTHYGVSPPVTVTTPPAKTALRDRPFPVSTLTGAPSAGWGFADLHTHQLADLGFGGRFFWGSSFGRLEDALRPCDPAHGLGGLDDLIGNIMTAVGTGGNKGRTDHHTGGAPHFDGWPMWYTINHQQMYVDWIKRAVDGGLRLMVIDAVNNGVYCTISADIVTPGTVFGKKMTSCDDMDAAKLQIREAFKVQQFVDSVNGGPGQGWYRIVRSAREARDAVSSGKLAVVLGIEVDQLFNCNNCTSLDIRRRLQEVYDMGVRKLIPVHLADNAFGGAAQYDFLFNINNYYYNNQFFDTFDCGNLGIAYKDAGIELTRELVLNSNSVKQSLGLGNATPVPPAAGGHCNTRSLTARGKFLIHEMMSKHMIIDVSHMGMRTLDSTLAITDSSDYPVIASHSSLLDVGAGEKKSERALSDAQIAAIRKDGGLIGVGLGGGNRSDVSASTKVPNDCGHSTKIFAQSYLTALKLVKGDAVALGSDMNGLEMMPAPRFGAEACAGDLSGPQPVATMVSYPFTGYRTGSTFSAMQIGDRTLDFNNDGFTQVGMYPEFIEDLQKIGLTSNDLDPLFRSADAFVRLWEKAESKNIAPLLALPPTLAVSVAPQPPVGNTKKLIVTVKDRETGVAKTGTVSIKVVNATSSSTVIGQTGQVLSYATCRTPIVGTGSPTTGGGRERDVLDSCPGHVSVAGYPDAPFTAP